MIIDVKFKDNYDKSFYLHDIKGFSRTIQNGEHFGIAPGWYKLNIHHSGNGDDVIEDMTKGKDPDFGWTDITLIPVIPDPAKILCIGLNYAKHVAETKRPDSKHPTIFTRFAYTQVGHNGIIYKPKG